MKNSIVGLRDLRENMEKYASRVERGESLIVVRRSKPLFKISAIDEDDDQNWERVADFTKINKNGASAERILKALQEMNG